MFGVENYLFGDVIVHEWDHTGLVVLKTTACIMQDIMGTQIVLQGKNYRIYNIDNVYTLYIKLSTPKQIDSEDSTNVQEIYSAIKSFSTLKEAKDYVARVLTKENDNSRNN